MKKIFKYALMAAAAICVSGSMVSCDDDDDNDGGSSDSVDATQQAIISDYVNNIVIPTYKSLADNAIALAEACEDLSTQAKVDAACASWIEARKYWERSEAFLYGAAADYNIDPHIDSWPLDLAQLAEVLKAGNIEDRIDAGTAGYGLLGFHAVEYVLFLDGSQGDASNRNQPVANITEAMADFAEAVSEDMRDQCVLLEAAWAGLDKVSAAKQAILEDAELEPSLNYGELLINAGLAGNTKYKTQAAAFEEIIVGASDIANEVGNTKISDPMDSHQWSDVESPHSWNSVTDFEDNIVSVRNAYLGSLDGTRSASSVSAHVASKNKNVDANVQAKIAAAITAIQAMPRPFRSYIDGTDAAATALIQAAVAACNDLVDALDDAQEVVTE